jgi:hypothetical protein
MRRRHARRLDSGSLISQSLAGRPVCRRRGVSTAGQQHFDGYHYREHHDDRDRGWLSPHGIRLGWIACAWCVGRYPRHSSGPLCAPTATGLRLANARSTPR